MQSARPVAAMAVFYLETQIPGGGWARSVENFTDYTQARQAAINSPPGKVKLVREYRGVRTAETYNIRCEVSG